MITERLHSLIRLWQTRVMKTPDSAALEEFVRRLKHSRRSGPCVLSVERLPAQPGQYAPMPNWVPRPLAESLRARGIERPYLHQVQAWSALRDGRDVAIVSPTASGKSLCYHVPILADLEQPEQVSALYLYPTKALSQDQCAEMNTLLEHAGRPERAHVYDGDTPAEIRRQIREQSRLVVTNPDMLHASILPNQESWAALFGSLRYIVVDEMHTYRGVFGSHVANVFRRLLRVCRHYGANPRFVLTSATIANPAELGEELIGRPVQLIDKSTAPRGERIFVLYNPPLRALDGVERRESPVSAARGLTASLMKEGRNVIVFARSRQSVEILTRRLRETMERNRQPHLAAKISGYRGGYLPAARRQIERGLRDGEIQTVVSTNALELGIDIGSLDVCIIAGYPGTIASVWQQAGRSGRRRGTSLTILIASDAPVDQFLVQHPEYFFAAPPEHARIDPKNVSVMLEHLKCAAFELSFSTGEAWSGLSVEDTQDLLAYLADESRLLTRGDSMWYWSTDGYPAAAVSLRAIADENFVIMDTTDPQKPEVLGEIDFESAHVTVYQQAIYQHDGTLYEVYRMDHAERKAWVRQAQVDYFTQAIDQTRVFILVIEEEAPLDHGWGEIRVCTRIAGYKKIRFRTWENIGYGEIRLPDLELHTTSYWATFRSSLLQSLGLNERRLGDAVAGISEAMRTVATIHLMCAAGDIKVVVQSRNSEAWDTESARAGQAPVAADVGAPLNEPTIFIYDRHPGGSGFSEKLHDLHSLLLRDTLSLIRDCPCEHGCPRCISPQTRWSDSAKDDARLILERTLDAPAHRRALSH
jgi:DEAD/DEAH box helicase domain-containing protein